MESNSILNTNGFYIASHIFILGLSPPLSSPDLYVRSIDFCDLLKFPKLLELLDLLGIFTSVLMNVSDLFALILLFIPN